VPLGGDPRPLGPSAPRPPRVGGPLRVSGGVGCPSAPCGPLRPPADNLWKTCGQTCEQTPQPNTRSPTYPQGYPQANATYPQTPRTYPQTNGTYPQTNNKLSTSYPQHIHKLSTRFPQRTHVRPPKTPKAPNFLNRRKPGGGRCVGFFGVCVLVGFIWCGCVVLGVCVGWWVVCVVVVFCGVGVLLRLVLFGGGVLG
jgi:hypothetical protein